MGMKWTDWLKARGINPDDEIPKKEDEPDAIKKEDVADAIKKEDVTDDSKKEYSAYLDKIESLQKEILDLKESNKNLALMGQLEHSTKSVEEEINLIMEEY